MGKVARVLLVVWPAFHAVPAIASPEAIVTPLVARISRSFRARKA